MIIYFVVKSGQPNGVHDVHTVDCGYLRWVITPMSVRDLVHAGEHLSGVLIH